MRVADWESWLTKDDVDGMVALGLNSVRVPLGFWIIEDIVDYSHEFYPRVRTFYQDKPLIVKFTNTLIKRAGRFGRTGV
jgi:aryl-phospho-beta-D-glucosidase BglC (GH1 family)